MNYEKYLITEEKIQIVKDKNDIKSFKDTATVSKNKQMAKLFSQDELGWYITDETGGMYLHTDGKLYWGAGKGSYFKSEKEAKDALRKFK